VASFVGDIASDDRDRGGACKAGEQKHQEARSSSVSQVERQEFDLGFSPTQDELQIQRLSAII
jgi:hypothetical protein